MPWISGNDNIIKKCCKAHLNISIYKMRYISAIPLPLQLMNIFPRERRQSDTAEKGAFCLCCIQPLYLQGYQEHTYSEHPINFSFEAIATANINFQILHSHVHIF